MSKRQPNFIFFNPDELRADAVHHLDGRPVCTPNLDRLAEDGVTFGRCFVPNTVCTPSRCAFMTGWYPHVGGHRTLWHMLQPHEPNLLRYLRKAGYYVSWHGKNDLLAEGSFATSVDHRSDAPARQPTFPDNPWPADHPHYRSFFYGCRGEAPYHDADRLHVEEAIDLVRRPPEQPFFLYLPLTFPHPPYTVEEPYFSLHDRDSVPEPLPAALADKPHFMGALHHGNRIDELSSEQLREIVATYYGMVTRTDALLGELLDALDSSPAAEDTIVVAMSDHGDYVGDYGLVEKWPTGFQDCLTRVPHIWRLPGGPRGRRVDSLVESIDFMPTVLELAGVEARHDHFGRSLLPIIRGETDRHRDAVFAEGGHRPHEMQSIEPLFPEESVYHVKTRVQQEDPSTVAKAAMVRTERWKYVSRLAGGDELYDLESDPGELANLIADPALVDVRAELRERLLRWFVETSDHVPRDQDRRR